MGSLYDARSIRAWLSNLDTFPEVQEMKSILAAFQEVSHQGGNAERDLFYVRKKFAEFNKSQREDSIASVFFAIALETPSSMINIALGSFLIDLAVYFGFVWTRNLDTHVGPGDSRDIFITFIVLVFFCLGAYSIARQMKGWDEPLARLYGRMRAMIDAVKGDGVEISENHNQSESQDVPMDELKVLEAQHSRAASIASSPSSAPRNSMVSMLL